MFNRLYPIISFFRFLSRSVNQHGVHSPFVYKLVTECFYDNKSYEVYKILKAYRNDLLHSKEMLEVTDYGAGSKVFKTPLRSVKKIAFNAGISLKRGYLLNRLTSYLHCKTILELGTSLGMATAAMAKADNDIKITTVEGCPETAAFAKKQFAKFKISNCTILTKTFDQALKENAANLYDLIYIDGNHSKAPTLAYFNSLLPNIHNDSVIVIDDIHWSAEMEAAWSVIVAHPRVTVSIDTYKWGIVFFRKQQLKQHFNIRV